jgi:hypothetical protein
VDVRAGDDPSSADLDRVEAAGAQLVVDQRMRETERAGRFGDRIGQLLAAVDAVG